MAQTQSITAKLINLARAQKVPFDRIMVSFLLERAVARLVWQPDLGEHLCFKGGYVALRVYGSSRFTKDVDALLVGIDKEEAITKIQDAMKIELDDGVWFKYHAQAAIKGQTDNGGLRFQYRAGLGLLPTETTKAQIIDIDVGIGDVVVPHPQTRILEPLLGSQELAWAVYPIETIIPEKLHCLAVLGASSTRAKDIYDIWQFLPQASASSLRNALKATFTQRKSKIPDSFNRSISALDLNLLRRGWQSAAGYIKDAPEFNHAVEQIISFLSEMEI
jgi:YD repeat-containing protein